MGITLQRLFWYNEDPVFLECHSRQGIDHCLFRHPKSTIVKSLEHRRTITSDVYCETLQSQPREQRQEACSHVSKVTCETGQV